MAKLGTIIRGKYKIAELVGKGGMSEVYRSVDVNLKKEWAVKEIKKGTGDEIDRIRIHSAVAEANMMKKLDHPAIPRVVDIIEEADVIYVIMDYIEGETLENLLSREGTFTVEKVVEWAKALCEVLAYLHRQNPPIIYRDMKPGNVIITSTGNVKLIDFGIAREYKDNDTTDTVCLGTRGYAAPEQATGITQTDQRTDIYNLGVTLYQLLTGKNPGQMPEKLRPIKRWRSDVPEGLEYIVSKCMQQNPYARYQNCSELLADLENYVELDSTGKEKDYYRRKELYNKILAGCGSAVIAIVVLVTAYFFKQGFRDSNTYNNHMQAAGNVTVDEEKLVHYLAAIEAKPEETAPYFALITMLGEDAVYEISEEQILRPLMEKNLHALQQHEAYAKLAFEMGKLYLNYYDYGKTETADNRMIRIKSALRWFEEAECYGEQTDAMRAEIQNYCAWGNYVKTLIQKPKLAADWGKYEVYRKDVIQWMESALQDNPESIYSFDEALTKMMGNYVREGAQIRITERSMEPLRLERMSIFLEENGVLRELEAEKEYTVMEKEKIGEWYTYEYCVSENIFLEEGIYEIELFSIDDTGRIHQNVRGMNQIEIVFGIDRTPPNIVSVDVTDVGKWKEENHLVTIIVEDDMMVENVEVYINKEACDVMESGEHFVFEVGKLENLETITVIARDAAGNETRKELEEVRIILEDRSRQWLSGL